MQWFEEGDKVIPGSRTLAYFSAYYTKDKVYVVTKSSLSIGETTVICDNGNEHDSLCAYNSGVSSWFIKVEDTARKRKGMR